MNWIARSIAGIWNFSRNSRVDVGGGLRPQSGASALLLFLILVFGLAGLVLVVLGFDLDRVDLWLDAQTGWLDLLGRLAIRAVLAVILLFCAVVIGGGIFEIGATAYGRLTGSHEARRRAEAEHAAQRRHREQGLIRAGSRERTDAPPASPPRQSEDGCSFVCWGLTVIGAFVVGYVAYVNLVAPL